MWMYLFLLYSTDSLGCRSLQNKTGRFPKFEMKCSKNSNNSWGGWNPNENDTSWKEWIRIWGQENSSVAFDSSEVDKDPASGWPRYWKGMGKGNAGVPAPPWAFVPENYGRPSFCYMQPDPGDCLELSFRWGFNPTRNTCERFLYSGCDGNENNFRNKHDCMESCGHVPDTECGTSKVNFRDYIDD